MTEDQIGIMVNGAQELYAKIGPILEGADGNAVFLLIGILLAEHHRQHPGKPNASLAAKAASEAMMLALQAMDVCEHELTMNSRG